MKVELISHTPNALALLLYTKNTRLMGAESLQDIEQWPEEKKLEHLAYMKDTIQSSWEFVDYTFHISEVTRAFTHQLVRTRTGSYAQQSQRTVDVRGNGYLTPEDEGLGYRDLIDAYDNSMEGSFSAYKDLIDNGMPVQDARGVLPTNAYTEIVTKFDLRTLHNMGLLRLCTRTQGEYQNVFKAMKEEVVKVHPWANDFIKVSCAWDGVCAFPRYTECPVQVLTYNGSGELSEPNKMAVDSFPHEERVKFIEKAWESTDHVAVPVAVDGKTM